MGQWTNQEKGQDALEELAMKVDDITRIAQELGIGRWQVERTIQLLDEGNTIPFIARYRKEMTGELNELQIRHIQERARQLRQLQSRREEIARLIEEQGNMTPELAEAFKLNNIQGVAVRGVVPDSPAAQAGLQVGDVITHIAGEPVREYHEALNRVAAMQPGEKVELRGVRDSQPFTLTAIIGERASVQSG